MAWFVDVLTEDAQGYPEWETVGTFRFRWIARLFRDFMRRYYEDSFFRVIMR
jgi:hypothetical protein